VFISKDENLTKAHVRYLESRLLIEAAHIKRFTLDQNQAGAQSFPNPAGRTWRCFWIVFASSFQSLALTF
jgi:hypothetical protein